MLVIAGKCEKCGGPKVVPIFCKPAAVQKPVCYNCLANHTQVLKQIAEQYAPSELDDPENADFEYAYEAIVELARKAIRGERS